MKKVLLTALFALGLWLSPSALAWDALSQAEIDDAHSCVTEHEIMICAGEKKIATGIWLMNTIGNRVIGDTRELRHYRPIPDAPFQVDAFVSLKQTADSGGPAWEKIYYVISDEQLARIIERARREPEWKP